MAWLGFGLAWHRYGGQSSAQLGFAMIGNGWLGLALLWSLWRFSVDCSRETNGL